jgi:hypothetical protein
MVFMLIAKLMVTSRRLKQIPNCGNYAAMIEWPLCQTKADFTQFPYLMQFREMRERRPWFHAH